MEKYINFAAKIKENNFGWTLLKVEHLRASHDEEMGEMIDVVNDLKVKEDELATVHRDLANQNNKIQELCKQLLSQEQSHKVRFFFARL